MGWNILRRTALTFLVFSCIGLSQAGSATVPRLPQKTDTVPPESVNAPQYRKPLQHHAPQKAWSVDIDTMIGSRPEVAYWVGRWATPEGLKKIQSSQQRYFDYRIPVNAIMRSSGLPWELSAIPVVESNWRIDAVSSSGAAGPWQFMKSSALGRQMIIDAWRDERRDIWISTEAAMKEFAFYHRLFSDWLLAVASYNAGPTRIGNLRRDSGAANFWELKDSGVLPGETGNYVPQVIAVAYITAHSGRFGLPISWNAPTRWVRLPLERSVPLDSLASALGYSQTRIRNSNRELNHPFTPPPGLPYMLKIPQSYEEEAIRWLSSEKSETVPSRFWRYTVKSGDTLSEIAMRYSISMSEMLRYNGHIRVDTLRIGERLYIPGNEDILPGVETDKLPLWTRRYTVGPGDSLWSIAKEFQTAPEILAEVNHRPLDGVLQAGSVLLVPDNQGVREQ
jgi:membrane-bound lytic murein transglycosylase D